MLRADWFGQDLHHRRPRRPVRHIPSPLAYCHQCLCRPRLPRPSLTWPGAALLGRASAGLFAVLPAGVVVSCTCVEVAGSKVIDLLGEARQRVELLEDGTGAVHLKGAAELPVGSAEELIAVLTNAQGARAAAATGVHDASSRSHSVSRIILRAALEGGGAEGGAALAALGRLDLVDLAGSEWAADRKQHDPTLQRSVTAAAAVHASSAIVLLPLNMHAAMEVLCLCPPSPPSPPPPPH